MAIWFQFHSKKIKWKTIISLYKPVSIVTRNPDLNKVKNLVESIFFILLNKLFRCCLIYSLSETYNRLSGNFVSKSNTLSGPIILLFVGSSFFTWEGASNKSIHLHVQPHCLKNISSYIQAISLVTWNIFDNFYYIYAN